MQRPVHGRLLTACLCFAVYCCLPGCASLYLHDAATQKQTDSAVAAIDAIKIEPIFASESSYLDGLQKSETSAVLAKFGAQRDHDILLVLDGTGPGGADGLTTLKSRIDGYLMTLIGVSDSECNRKLWRALDIDPSKQWGTTSAMTALSQAIANSVNAIKDPANCPPSTPPKIIIPLQSVSPSASVYAAAQTVLDDLKKISDFQTDATAAKQQLDTALSNVKNQMAAGKTAAAAFTNDLNSLKNALTSANPLIKQYISATLSAEVSATIDALSPPSSKQQSGVTAEERDGIAVMQALFGVGDAFASPPRVPHPNALAAAQSWLNYVGSQAATQLENQKVQLKDHQVQFAAVLTTIYYLSKSAEQVQGITDERGKRLRGTEGVAVLLDSKNEASIRAVNAAVIYYASAWTHGFAVDAAAARLGYIDQRRADLTTGRAASTAWLGSLKPAVETLSSYGTGGFDPQIIVQLIQALSVAGVAVGVNK